MRCGVRDRRKYIEREGDKEGERKTREMWRKRRRTWRETEGLKREMRKRRYKDQDRCQGRWREREVELDMTKGWREYRERDSEGDVRLGLQ